MASRRERVILELEDRFSPGMAKATASTMLFKKSLADLDGTSMKVDRALKETTKSGSGVSREFDRGSSSIDQFSGRLGLAARALGALGPAAVPVAAVAIPAMTGLAAAMGATALAGGTAVLAFQGVGDALSALNAAQLDPTTANLEKARQAFDAISPSAQQFVMDLDAAAPALAALKASAGQDLFPGLSSGLKGALTELPRARLLLEAIGGAIGNLGEMTGDSLSSGAWGDFLEFLTREAPPAIESLGRTVGNLAMGMADLWVSFTPLNNGVLDFLEQGSQGFQDWADGLSATAGFQEFVEYVQTTGPQVGAALESVGNALLQIVEAAAPIGGPVLQIVESLADAVATIADSPIGTPLFGLVAAMSALSLATRGYAAVQRTAFGAPAVAQVRGTVTSLRAATTAQERLTAVTSGGAKSLAGQAGLLAGLALASSGVADKFGLSNAASLALAGSLGGPVGAALGFTAGALMDMSHSTDSLNASLEAAADLSGDSLTDLLDKQNALVENFSGLSNVGRTFAFLGGDYEKFKTEYADLQAQIDSLKSGNVSGQAALGSLLGAGVGLTGPVKDAAAATEQLSIKSLQLAHDQETAAKALHDSRVAARGTADQFFGLGDSLDDSKVSLDGWLADLEQQATALRNFQRNAREAGDKGLRQGLIRALEEAGPAGATRMAELANATDAQITRANKAWKRGQGAVKDYTDAIGGVPASVTTDVNADTGQANANISALGRNLANLKSKTIYINAVTRRTGAGGQGGEAAGGFASGGFTGRGGKFEPAGIVHRGEVVIPADRVKSDWSMLKARYGDLPGFAGGGVVTKKARANQRATRALGNLDVDLSVDAEGASDALGQFTDDVDHIRDLFKDAGRKWSKSLDEQTDTIRKSARQFDSLNTTLTTARNDRAAFAGSVGTSLGGSLFGNGLAGFQAAANANTADYTAAQGGLAAAIANGLDGPLRDALAASGDINALKQFGGLSAGQITVEEQRYAALQAAQSGFGNTAAAAKYDASIAAYATELKRNTAAIERLEKQLPDAVERGAERGSHSGTESGTAKGVRSSDVASTQLARTTGRGGGHRGNGR